MLPKAARLYFFAFHLVCVTVILNIFSAFVIEAFILEFSVTSAGDDKGRPLPQSPLMKRIAGMGLSYRGKQASLSESGEDFLILDADHDLEIARHEGDANNGGMDCSQLTGLRFRLTSRTRTVMGLLEKMFE